MVTSKKCFIIGGGPSLKGFQFSALSNCDTIVTNKSIFDLPNSKYFVTVDYTFLRKVDVEIFKSISTTKVFVVDLSYSFIEDKFGKIIDTRYNMPYDLSDYDVIVKSRKKEGFGYTLGDFSTGINSGYCALQLAIILGYTKIGILGIDLNCDQTTHYHSGYNNNLGAFRNQLNSYYEYFDKGLKQIKKERPDIHIVSCSASSKLNDIIDFVDFRDSL